MALKSTTSSEPVRLFISYAREERDRVEWLAGTLARAGYRVWWDAALEGGHQFAAEINRELGAADAVLVVWSEDAVHSNWVLDEAMVGRDRGCLIPVRFDATQPPLGFRQIQVIDLEEGGEADAVDAIARAAARLLNQPVPAAPKSSAGGKSRAVRKGREERPIWLPFAWVGVGVFIWILANFMK